MRSKILMAALAAFCAAGCAAAEPAPEPAARTSATDTAQALFTSGDGGVAVYRIPAIVTAPNGDLVAVCDAREKNGADLNGGKPIDIVIRRSSDNGRTWTPRALVHDFTDGYSASDPSLVVDHETKTIFCFCNVWDNTRRKGQYLKYVQESHDDGKTWSEPRDITAAIHRKDWGPKAFVFMTSGHGCQLRDGTLLNTLVQVGKGVCLFGSRDHGKTWGLIGNPARPGDESKVIELADGSWMINSRAGGGARYVHVSKDKGTTWTTRREARLVDPACNAGLVRCHGALLFVNANSPKGRRNLTLRASRDEGATWTDGLVLDPGGAAYSDLAVMKDGRVGVLYEGAGYKSIIFKAVDPAAFLPPSAPQVSR